MLVFCLAVFTLSTKWSSNEAGEGRKKFGSPYYAMKQGNRIIRVEPTEDNGWRVSQGYKRRSIKFDEEENAAVGSMSRIGQFYSKRASNSRPDSSTATSQRINTSKRVFNENGFGTGQQSSPIKPIRNEDETSSKNLVIPDLVQGTSQSKTPFKPVENRDLEGSSQGSSGTRRIRNDDEVDAETNQENIIKSTQKVQPKAYKATPPKQDASEAIAHYQSSSVARSRGAPITRENKYDDGSTGGGSTIYRPIINQKLIITDTKGSTVTQAGGTGDPTKPTKPVYNQKYESPDTFQEPSALRSGRTGSPTKPTKPVYNQRLVSPGTAPGPSSLKAGGTGDPTQPIRPIVNEVSQASMGSVPSSPTRLIQNSEPDENIRGIRASVPVHPSKPVHNDESITKKE